MEMNIGNFEKTNPVSTPKIIMHNILGFILYIFFNKSYNQCNLYLLIYFDMLRNAPSINNQ